MEVFFNVAASKPHQLNIIYYAATNWKTKSAIVFVYTKNTEQSKNCVLLAEPSAIPRPKYH